MNTREALAVLAKHRGDAIVVCALGMAANEWWAVTQSEDSFYMHGGMGFAASFALGLATALPEVPVWVLNSDGSLSMNLGCLLTEAGQQPQNLKHFVVDNQRYQTVDTMPMVNQDNSDYAMIAKGAGIRQVATIDNLADFFASNRMAFQRVITSSTDESIKAYERLVTVDKVHILLGPYSSPITVQASTVAEKHGIPMIALEANSTAIYTRGFKWLVGVIDDGPKWSHHYFDMLKAEGRVKTMAIVIQETGHTKEAGGGAVAKAKAVGINVVVEESAPARPVDYTPIIAKMKAANPDVVFVAGFPAFNVAFYKQALEQGLNPREYHVIHHGSAFRKAVGEAEANLVIGENYWMPGIKKGNWQMFEEMLQKTGIKVEDYPWAGIRMFGLDALKATLEKAGSLDREKLMAAAWTLDIETISGRLRFQKKGEAPNPNAQGQGTLNPFPTQIQEGKYVTLWPQDFATGKHVYPRGAR